MKPIGGFRCRRTPQPVTIRQEFRLFLGTADDHHLVVRPDHLFEELGRHIAAGGRRQLEARHHAQHIGQKPAVQEHELGGTVQLAKRRLIVEPDEVVDIRRYGVSV